MRILFALPLVIALAACSASNDAQDQGPETQATQTDYAAVLADDKRPGAERDSDAVRKPAELLAFAQIEPGEKVGDYIMGGGYWTRILSHLVGPTGKVYGFQPDEAIEYRAEYGSEQDAAVAGRENAVALRGPMAAPQFPEPLDTIITVQNLHDLYMEQLPADTGPKAIAALYAALKPGGTLVVVDHSAVDGSGIAAAAKLHRMDREAAIAALKDAGFVLEEESDLYLAPADPRTASIFDPSIRGKTSQFVLRLRKPA